MIRLKLLKLGAQIRRSARHVSIAMASTHPWQYEFGVARALLRGAAG